MQEPVRLVIWDLDETFWRGTLTEGGICIRPDTIAIVKTLAERGIVSSICSKNDFVNVTDVLKKEGIWEYFVFPSIDWTPKGPRIGQIISDMQLRPSTVMFIDDNPINLQEAIHVTPHLQVATPEFIECLLESRLFVGKKDPALQRLQQYKILELRKIDQGAAGTDIREFLRSSNIRVTIEHDVVAYIDRAIELINRTNQLNFLKNRLPEDLGVARQLLIDQLSSHEIRAGLIKVRDNYGDHGWAGFYMLHNNGKLLQYAFSCRILGMGVETWLYNKLGQPRLNIVGEVLTDVRAPADEIDWIRLEDGASAGGAPLDEKIVKRIVARGGCDLMPIAHYFGLIADEVVGEFNQHRDGLDGRIDHSVFLRAVIDGISDEAVQEGTLLCYRPGDFTSALFSEQTGADVWILSFWSDAAYVIYRNKKFAFEVPFTFPGCNQRDARTFDTNTLPDAQKNTRMTNALDVLREAYEYIGFISEDNFKKNIHDTLAKALPTTRIVILMANEFIWRPDQPVSITQRTVDLNAWTRAVASRFSNTLLINIRDFVHNEKEVHGHFHFERMVYYRIFTFIHELLKAGEWRMPASTWAFHTLPDPEQALLQCKDAPILARTAAFLLRDGRFDEAVNLAARAAEMDPNSISHKLIMFEALLKTGRAAEAEGLVAAIERSDVSAEIFNGLARHLLEAKQFAMAEELFRRAVEAEPSNFFYRHGLANSFVAQGRTHEAVAVFRRCIDDGDQNPHVQAHLVRLVANLGRSSEARELLARFIAINPNFEALQHLGNILNSRTTVTDQ